MAIHTTTPAVVDYIIIGIVGFSVLVSLVRGFVREALSLVTWIAAVWIAMTFDHILAEKLQPYIHTPSIQIAMAFLALFIGTLILGGVINFIIGQFVEKTGLTGTDRMIGMVFGFARGVLLVAVLLLVSRSTPVVQDPWWKASLLIPHFAPVENWLHNLLPESINSHFPTPS